MHSSIMYRTTNMDSAQETFSNYLGLNVKCYQQDMYSDNSSTTTTPSISPATSSSAASFTPSSPSPVEPATDVIMLQQQHLHQAAGCTEAAAAAATNAAQLQVATMNAMCNMHQQLQQQQLHQQQLAAAAVAQQQLALAAAACSSNGSSQQHQDEISKSLQMFAMLTAYKTGNEQTHPSKPVEAIMQDFACNGYICDELNRFQQYQAAMHFANSNNNNTTAPSPNCNITNSNNNNNSLHQTQINVNLHDVRNNLWKMLPSHMQHTHAATAAAAAAAANIDYNSNKKPQQKRFNGGGKNEKYSPAKHCVFCENNNEPEAVVKSHAVRDSLGRVLCPKLRTYICPICKASGDMAHTVKYCPQKPIITMEDAIKAESFRLAKGTYYKQQMKV